MTFLYVLQNPEFDKKHKLKRTLEASSKRERIESHITLNLKHVESIARDERSGKFQIIKSMGAPFDLDTKLDRSTY